MRPTGQGGHHHGSLPLRSPFSAAHRRRRATVYYKTLNQRNYSLQISFRICDLHTSPSLSLSLMIDEFTILVVPFCFVFDRNSQRTMVRKRFPEAKTGIEWNKMLKKVGLGKEDMYFWKQIGKALLCTYAVFGAVWLYNEKSPLGWWTLMPRPKEEKELAHLYERREFPYPGDKEAMEEFIAKGGMIGTTIGPKGMVENDKDSYNYQKALQDKKFDQEAQKLWLRMRNEVIADLQEKGFDVE